MIKNLYIGEFPPPIGGVTIKNLFLRDHIYKSANVNFFNLYTCKKNPLNLFALFWNLFLTSGGIMIGVGENKRLERLLQLILIIKGRRSLERCSIIMMGSTLHEYSKGNPRMQKYLRNVHMIYSESRSFNQEFLRQGIVRTDYFPNCRVITKESCCWEPKMCNMAHIRLLYFSRICKEKGAHYLFNVIDLLNARGISVDLDYYGVIDHNYECEFKQKLRNYSNVRYRGVFDSTNNDVYKKLREYDVLLFPTIWKGEGVPGILIESKIAGIPSIVTAHNYNEEVVADGNEGLVVSTDNIVDGFAEKIYEIQRNPKLYKMLADGAFKSRERYNIKNYYDVLIQAVK